MNKIVVFASGGGSNFKSIYSNTENGKIGNTKVTLLVSNNPKSGAVKFANEKGINTFILNSYRFPEKKNYNEILVSEMNKINPDLIVLAGYMKLIPYDLTSLYKRKIINIHPGKLPAFGGKGFYGMNVHRAVLDSGDSETAVTIHYVNEEYDQGMIIHEEKVPVESGDSPMILSERVLDIEHKVYSEIINSLLND